MEKEEYEVFYKEYLKEEQENVLWHLEDEILEVKKEIEELDQEDIYYENDRGILEEKIADLEDEISYLKKLLEEEK